MLLEILFECGFMFVVVLEDDVVKCVVLCCV